MESIAIEHIGPIEHAQLNLNKVNLFIGPQSSGKSTIAKLVTFCQWLEKHVVINQGTDGLDDKFFSTELIAFHGFQQFFSKESRLVYKSDLISLNYSPGNSSVKIAGDLSRGLMSKVAYIPSERNLVGLPNITSLQLERNYIRSFIFDWLGIRGKYRGDNRYPVLNLGVAYHYDDAVGDLISLAGGKELMLAQSSSGLQALIPLLIFVDYVTRWIYENDADISFDKYASLQQAVLKQAGNDGRDALQPAQALKLPGVKQLIDRIARPHRTKLAIEEGEINIFPSTQYQLVKQLMASMNFDRGDSLLLTTHSPYVMTSVNNLIQAGNMARTNPAQAKAIEQIIPRRSWLQYADVNAWAVEHGTVTSINDDELQLIAADALDRASDEIASDYDAIISL